MRIKNLFSICLSVSMLLVCLSACNNQGIAENTSTPEETQISLEGKKLIALTIDDGPNNGVMPHILDVLEAQNVSATFFLVGKNITDNTKDVILRAKELGCEFGNHSYSHEKMTEKTVDELINDYQKTQKLIKDITGEEPAYYRPPFLSYNRTLSQNINSPLIGGYMFSDWEEYVTKEDIIEGMYDVAEDGAIFLLHCTSSTTVEALEAIIPMFREDGYEFVTLSTLFEMKGVTPEAHDFILYKNIR